MRALMFPLALLLLAGCVAKQDYVDLETRYQGSEGTVASLQEQITQLEGELSQVRAQAMKLERRPCWMSAPS